MKSSETALLYCLLDSFKRAREDLDKGVSLEVIARDLKELESTAEILQRRLENAA